MNEVKIIFNVLCNKRVRIERLEALIDQLICLNPKFISVRLRGQFAVDAKSLLEVTFSTAKFSSFNIWIGNSFKSWKINTIEQILYDGPYTEYVGIFQEDFRIMAPADIVRTYIDRSILLGREAIELCSGPYYGIDSPSHPEILKCYENYVLSLDLDKQNIIKHGRVVHALTSWPSIYKTDLALRALLSDRPYFKKFHPDFPFDWEKSTRAKWLLPIKWCAPRFELFACIDYDSLWPGSSLQSRGLVNADIVREDDTLDNAARKTADFFHNLNRLTFNLTGKLDLAQSPKVKNFKHKLKRSNIYLNAIRYTFISLLLVPFRLDERRMRAKTKSLLQRSIRK